MKSSASFGQDIDSRLRMDTVILKQGQIFSIHNHTYLIKKDTVIFIPSNIKYEIKPSRSERFYNKLAMRANKNILTRGLQNIVIAKPKNNGNYDSLKTSPSVLPFVSYNGHPIRHINIKQLNVFGPSVYDTNRMANTWLERTGNKLHFQSKERIIRNNLLFKEGNNLDPVKLADNERLLRSLPYIEDARIIVKPAEEQNDSVDVTVITKDVWSTAFDVKIETMHTGRFELWDQNILGFGHEIQNSILWDSRTNTSTGYNGIYSINNIAGSFIQSHLYYYDAFQTKSAGVNLQRNFFTPNIKYAGGLSIATTKTPTQFKEDSLYTAISLRYNSYDGWVGRSFLLGKDGFTKTRRNLTFAARITNNYFFQRPPITQNSFYSYQNKTLFLGSISYASQSFFKSNFIYNFGRTEDIPIGGQAQVILGFEKNEFFNRRYGGLNLSAGNFLWNLGYFYSSINLSSFFDYQYNVEQGIITGKFNFFSPLILVHKFRLRQFVDLDYTQGVNRFTNEYLTINNLNGITGFTNDSVTGNVRLNMHLETVCFTPWYFFDFRFVVFGFADFSWLEKRTEYLFDKFPYTGIGLGIRIRNEHLAFNTLQIRFSFYPNIPSRSRTRILELSGEPVLNLPSFLPSAPALVPFQ